MHSVGWFLLRFWETGFFVAVRKRNTEDNALSAVHVRATTSLTWCRAVHVRMMTTQASTSLSTRCRAVHVRMMTTQASTSLTRCRSVHVRAVGDRPVRHLLDVGSACENDDCTGQYGVTYSMSGSACEASTSLTRCRASWADCRCRTSCSRGQKYWLPPQEEPAATAQRVTQENVSPHRIARE